MKQYYYDYYSIKILGGQRERVKEELERRNKEVLRAMKGALLIGGDRKLLSSEALNGVSTCPFARITVEKR
jgi:3'-phosphoadenosine 5'-phosphosulfate sulfotransferase